MRALGLTCMLLASSLICPAQTRLKISAIKPGTEQVQLVPNGDFQFQGPLSAGNYPDPTGWSRLGDTFANAGSNMVSINLNVVARGHLDGGAPVGLYQQPVTLEPATD